MLPNDGAQAGMLPNHRVQTGMSRNYGPQGDMMQVNRMHGENSRPLVSHYRWFYCKSIMHKEMDCFHHLSTEHHDLINQQYFQADDSFFLCIRYLVAECFNNPGDN